MGGRRLAGELGVVGAGAIRLLPHLLPLTPLAHGSGEEEGFVMGKVHLVPTMGARDVRCGPCNSRVDAWMADAWRAKAVPHLLQSRTPEGLR